MKPRHTLMILALVILLTSAPAIAEDDLVRMDTSMFESPQRIGSVFDHDEHNTMAGLDEDCSICHHVYEDGKRVEGESSEDLSCSECHSIKGDDENSVPLRMAFHTQCRSCHVNEKKGPVLCGQCHIRK